MQTKLPAFHLRSYLLIQHLWILKICRRKKNADFARCLTFIITVTAKHSMLFVPIIGLSGNKVYASPPGFSSGKYFDSWIHSM